jgi:hypothetical protein
MVSMDDWGLRKKQKARKNGAERNLAITLTCMLSKAIPNVIPNPKTAGF